MTWASSSSLISISSNSANPVDFGLWAPKEGRPELPPPILGRPPTDGIADELKPEGFFWFLLKYDKFVQLSFELAAGVADPDVFDI